MLELIECSKQQCEKIAYRPKCKYLTKYKSNSIQFSSLQEVFSEVQTTAQGPIVKPTLKTQMQRRKSKNTQKRNVKQREQKRYSNGRKIQIF
jgi:uncharacterized protein with gpF-like domain